MLIAYDWTHEAHFLGYAVNGVRTAKPDWLRHNQQSRVTARWIGPSMTVSSGEDYAFAATARASRLRACGVLRTSAFIFANPSAFSGWPPAASQNSAAWSAKASG